MRLRVEVTDEDIDAGKACDSETCAVALAALRAINDGSRPGGPLLPSCRVAIGVSAFILYRPEADVLVVYGRMPRTAESFVKHFDNWKDDLGPDRPKPIEFEVDLDDKAINDYRRSVGLKPVLFEPITDHEDRWSGHTP